MALTTELPQNVMPAGINNASDYSRPLVTFALFAYNQERFIREAVEGALSQTYSPLEIILSDDCSTDRTYEIIENMVSEYSGPHLIRLNRNSVNCGICGHVNIVVDMMEGELIIFAAGDDVSLSNRTELLCEKWIEYHQPELIISNFVEVNEYGKTCKELIFDKSRGKLECYLEIAGVSNAMDFIDGNAKIRGVGATQAISKNLFDIFGPISEASNNEDTINFFRAFLTGGRLYVPDVLVKYRVHNRSISYEITVRKDESIEDREYLTAMSLKFIIPAYDACKSDLKVAYANKFLNKEEYNIINHRLNEIIRIKGVMSVWVDSRLLDRVWMYIKIVRIDGSNSQKVWCLKRLFGSVFLKHGVQLKHLIFRRA